MAMKFRQAQKIAVIGDLMLDEFVYGSVNRLNPEAPVPVLNIKNREYRLGGAANVAANIHSLGGDCLLLGRVGRDQRIEGLLDQIGIKHCLIVDENLSTAIKTRFVANNQQLLRVDAEKVMPLGPSHTDQILRSIQDYDIFLIADYGKGVITQELMDSLRETGKMILVDPKDLTQDLFRGVFLIKPNLLEAQKWVSVELDSGGAIERGGSSLQKTFASKVLLTRGKEGISLFQSGREPLHFPSQAREVYDVSGAGDTVIATVGLCLASGIELEEAIVLANRAAGIVVGKLGTAVVFAKELFASVEHENHKVKTGDEISSVVKELRKHEKKIVFTNGCFDILHVGHTKLLKKARSLGDVLILGLNSDGSIKRLKGPNRPIMGENERADILASLECVDYVVFFHEDDPCNLISMIKPDVHVKGGDYIIADDHSMPEAKLIEQYGGKVVFVNYIEGESTSAIIEKIKTR